MGELVTDPDLLAALEGNGESFGDMAVDDATAAELDRQSQRDRTRQAAQDAYADMDTSDRFWTGVARPFVETGLGIKDLAGRAGIGGGLTEEDRANLERLEQVQGGAGTAGRVAGELMTFAVPGAGAAKIGAKAATVLPRTMARLAPLAADAATMAGMEALKAPTEDTSRSERAAEGALGALGGAVAGKVVKGVVKGLRPRPEAAELMRQGVRLTPGMARGGAVQWLEEKAASIPGLAKPIRARQQEAVEDWNRTMLQRAMPAGEVTKAGHEGFQEVTKAFDAAYEHLWQGKVKLDLSDLDVGWEKGVEAARDVIAPEAARMVGAKLKRLVNDQLLRATDDLMHVDGPAISAVDDALRKEASLAARRGDGDVAKVYGAARTQLRQMLPQEITNQLSKLDGMYRQFATLRRAGGYKASAMRGGTFTPSQLMGAAVAADRSVGKGAVARGQAALQKEADAAGVVIGRGARPLGTAEKLGLGAAALLNPGKALAAGAGGRLAYSRAGTRYLTGQTRAQRALANAAAQPRSKAVIDAIRTRLRATTIGAAVAD